MHTGDVSNNVLHSVLLGPLSDKFLSAPRKKSPEGELAALLSSNGYDSEARKMDRMDHGWKLL